MSTGHALLTKQTRWAAAVETTAGTAVALSGTNGAFITAQGGALGYRIGTTRRQKPGSATNLIAKAGTRAADVSLTVEMMGKGSSGIPDWANFLLAAGFANSSGTLSLVTGSASADTLTVGKYTDGQLRQAAGCAFNAVFRLTVGQVGMVDLTGEGCYVAPTATALITPTYPTVNPPTVRGITFTIGGTTYTTNEITIDLGNVLYLREDVTSATGYKACAITDRDPTLTTSLESVAIGTHDWTADFVAETEAAISIVIGSASNETITFTIPNAQIREAPGQGDRNGILTDDLVFQLNSNDSREDDSELSVVFS